MPYVAQVLQILIASPGDVNDEREIIAKVIQEWNYLNSHERSVVLLPLRWETHAYPEIGVPPQAAINKQVVDYCDMAIGVFWTRLGTPTEKAESGTAEEIARVADAGKPVMLYFSDAKIRPQSIDIDQYKHLGEFKKILRPKSLIEDYSTIEEFRDKLRVHLDRIIRDIVSQDSAKQSHGSVGGESLVLGITEQNPPGDLSSSNKFKAARVICKDRDEIPDYVSSGNTTLTTGSYAASSATVFAYGMDNREYYRQLVDYYCEALSRTRAWLAIANSSDESARDIHLDIKAKASSGAISVNPPDLRLPGSSLTLQTGMYGFLPMQGNTIVVPEKLNIEDISTTEWRIETDISIVQPRRTVVSPGFFYMRAEESGSIIFDATTYSSGALPFSLKAEVQIIVEPLEVSYRDILRQMIPGYGEDVTDP